MQPTTSPPGRAESAPIGALGEALARVQATPSIVVLVAAGAVIVAAGVFLLPTVASALATLVGPLAATWIAGALSIAAFTLAVAAVALLPPLLLAPPDRAASAVHAWIGAREVRRALGAAHAATSIPTSAEETDAWLIATPDTDALRLVRFEVFLMARRFEDARRLVDRFPAATPLDRYRRVEALALVDDQTGEAIDEVALRQAVSSVPAGVDRIEAAASLAVLLARRGVPSGRWREPLLEVRPLIPGSDAALLVRDFGLPIFTILARKVVVPVAALIVVVAAALTLSSLVG